WRSASSAARRRSTPIRGASTGACATRPCWPAAASAADRATGPATNSPLTRAITRWRRRTCWRRAITAWGCPPTWSLTTGKIGRTGLPTANRSRRYSVNRPTGQHKWKEWYFFPMQCRSPPAERRSFMRRGTERIVGWAAVGVLLLFTTGTVRADVIYNNLGPGDTYQTGVGWTLGLPGTYQDVGNRFTPAGTSYTLDTIALALGYVTGTNAVDVALMTDAGGLPGLVIES